MKLHRKMWKRKNSFDTKWFYDRVNYLRSNDLTFKALIKITFPDLINWKTILIKVIFFLCLCAILMPISLHLEYWALHLTVAEQKKFSSHGLIEVLPIGNPGIEYSMLAKSPVWVVFFIESITIILASFCLIVIEPRFYYLLPLCFCLIGGIMNTNSRDSYHEFGENSYFQFMHNQYPNDPVYMHKNIVIDYWHFRGGWSIFNFNDTLVISGTAGFVLAILVVNCYIYFPILKRNNKKTRKVKWTI